jgi:acylphosphatase
MTVRIYISGFVQGVGFRQFLKAWAKRLNLLGWVKNLSDGNVEVFVQGEGKDVQKMIAECRKGPFLASVKDVTITKEKDQSFKSFEILH